jgi:GDP-L-fucose synthase
MNTYSSEQPINVGCESDISIGELARLIRDTLGMPVEVAFDTGRPEGAASKLLDSSRVRSLGWTPSVTLAEGIRRTYQWLTDNWSSPAIRRIRTSATAPVAH